MSDFSDTPPLFSVSGLTKHYRLRGSFMSRRARRIVPAVDGIDLQLYRGKTLALVGESGCGKSTVAKLIMQLETPDAGEMRLDGDTISTTGKRDALAFRRQVQMVFQDPYGSLTPHMRVGSLLREPLLIHRVCPPDQFSQRVAAALEAVGLAPDVANRFPHELSGGQRQRVGIARGIAVGPKLLICDEPVSALDVSIRSQIINLLLELQQKLQLSYLFISHDLGLVDHISDDVCVMYLGKVVERAPAAAFFAAPRHPYSHVLIASSPIPDPRQRGRIAAAQGEVSTSSVASGCRFHPRCPLAVRKCVDVEPVLRVIGPNHLVACHRAEELFPESPAAALAISGKVSATVA